MFFRVELISIKLKAIRMRIRFRMLDRAERDIIDLTNRVVDVVRSDRLARVLSNAIRKLGMARDCGNIRAKNWARDKFYAIYLGLSFLNKSAGIYP
jgi:hypothetical protein